MADIPFSAPSLPWAWKWVRDTLRWSLLRRPGVLACLAEGVCRAADDVLRDIYWLRDQFNPATCEPEYVDRFGAARGLTRHPRETGEQWRRRVCAALAWHKLAGRAAGMPRILEHYGYSGAVMVNMAAEGETAKWAHFRCDLVAGAPVMEEDWNLIRWVLDETKPAKSVLESLTIVIAPRAVARLGAACCSGEVVSILPWSPAELEASSSARAGIGAQAVEIVTITYKLEA